MNRLILKTAAICVLGASLLQSAQAFAYCEEAYQNYIAEREKDCSLGIRPGVGCYSNGQFTLFAGLAVPALTGVAAAEISKQFVTPYNPVFGYAGIAAGAVVFWGGLHVRKEMLRAQIKQADRVVRLIRDVEAQDGLDLQRFYRSEKEFKHRERDVLELLRMGNAKNEFCLDDELMKLEDVRQWVKDQLRKLVLEPEYHAEAPGVSG